MHKKLFGASKNSVRSAVLHLTILVIAFSPIYAIDIVEEDKVKDEFANHKTKEDVYKVELVQIVHRHGARSASVKFNQSDICGTRYPCGELNREGATMMFNVGRFLRHRYCNTEPQIYKEVSQFLLECKYNNTWHYIRSTDYSRTLQSANALVAGWFTNENAIYESRKNDMSSLSFSALERELILPVIHSINRVEDTLLSTEANPALRMKYTFGVSERRKACEPVVDAFLNSAVIAWMAYEVHAEGYCAHVEDRLACVETLCDIAEAYEATGELVNYPTLHKYFSVLRQVRLCTVGNVFVYNRDNAEHARQGSFAQVLLHTLVDNMHRSISGSAAAVTTDKSTSNKIKVYQYSTHDTELVTLGSTLEFALTTNTILPPFGSTYIFELLTLQPELVEGNTNLSDNANTQNEMWFVRVLRGYPEIKPENEEEHMFHLESFQLKCMSSSNAIYMAFNATCPLNDFVRFVMYNDPQSETGLCNINATLIERMNCSSDAEVDKRPLSEYCKWYRMQCPTLACDAEHYLSGVDYNCYARNISKNFDDEEDSSAKQQQELKLKHALQFMIFFIVAVFVVCLIYVR